VPVAADATASFGTPEATSVMLLLNLTKDLHTGSSYPITFTFANAGTVTVAVPVALTAPGSVPGSTIPVELGTAAN
jgi:copper(I)-binding protein